MANAIGLNSISMMGSAGFLLIFAAVNTANALHVFHTKSRTWISAVGAVACLAAMVALAVIIEGIYRLTKREIDLHE